MSQPLFSRCSSRVWGCKTQHAFFISILLLQLLHPLTLPNTSIFPVAFYSTSLHQRNFPRPPRTHHSQHRFRRHHGRRRRRLRRQVAKKWSRDVIDLMDDNSRDFEKKAPKAWWMYSKQSSLALLSALHPPPKQQRPSKRPFTSPVTGQEH